MNVDLGYEELCMCCTAFETLVKDMEQCKELPEVIRYYKHLGSKFESLVDKCRDP